MTKFRMRGKRWRGITLTTLVHSLRDSDIIEYAERYVNLPIKHTQVLKLVLWFYDDILFPWK